MQFLADAVRTGVLTPPELALSGPPPVPAPVARLDEILNEHRRKPARPVIVWRADGVRRARDINLAEDRRVRRIRSVAGNAHGFLTRFCSTSCPDTAACPRPLRMPRRGGAPWLSGRVAILELTPKVLARALDAFPGKAQLRTLDANCIWRPCAYLADNGQPVALASYDRTG